MKDTYLVAGCGISGIGAAKLLLNVDARVILYDGNTALDPEGIKGKLGNREGVTVVLGELTDEVAKQCKACVYYMRQNATCMQSLCYQSRHPADHAFCRGASQQ